MNSEIDDRQEITSTRDTPIWDDDEPADNPKLSDWEEDEGTVVALLLRDGLDHPIQHLPVRVGLPDGSAIETTSTDLGAITIPLPPDKNGCAILSVLGLDGEMQEVCSIELARCETGAIIRSPKVVAPLQLKTRDRALAEAAANTATMPSAPPPKTQTNQPASTDTPQQVGPSASKGATRQATSTASSQKASSQQDCKAEAHPDEGPWYKNVMSKAWDWLTVRVHQSDKKPPTCGASTTRSEQAHVSNEHVVKESASKAGNPITVVVGPECPNAENLWLGLNNIYREHIHKAAKHCGMSPQAISALIDAEAARIPEYIPLVDAKGKPLLDKKKKPMKKMIGFRWYARSHNINPKTGDGAAGLTQFIPRTWLDQGIKPGYYLYKQFKTKGWAQETKDKNGKVSGAFVLSTGKTTTDPIKHKSDPAVKACLEERFNPEWSIMAAADYAKYNLEALKKKGLKLSGLSDSDKAKLMYLMHHEGEPNGPWFIKNELSKHISERNMKATLIQQIGEKNLKKVEKMIKDAGDDVFKAYRMWLTDYIDHKIAPKNFLCDKSSAEFPTACFALLEKIGGSGE